MNNFCKIIVLPFFIVLSILIQVNVESKSQYVQPLMMGMQVAIPYDIANIWNRPVSFSPVLSTFLGCSLLYILFFGVITAPFGYMFGVPSQKYVIGTSGSDSLITVLLNNAETWKNYTLMKEAEEQLNNSSSEDSESTSDTPRSFDDDFKPLLRKILGYSWDYPEFNDIFTFLPDKVLDEYCQQLVLCHAHSAFNSLPDYTTPAYRVFSRTLTNIPEMHKVAIKMGLMGADCDMEFSTCPSDIYSLSLRLLLTALPNSLRKILMMPQF